MSSFLLFFSCIRPKMKVLALIFAAIVAVNASNQCPKDEELTWEKDVLLEHELCNKFYKCSFGSPVEMSCADGLFFNHELGICDWKHNVDCGDRNIPDDKPTSGEDDGGDDDDKGDGNENDDVETDVCAIPGKDVPESGVLENGCPIDPTVHWLLPHEEDCNKFYYCVNGAKIEQQCFGPLHFNSRLQVCDLPTNACCAKSFNKHVSGRRILMRK
ncbi:peritrophin-1-like [Papilio machaon]|uniref:peritrophin-1-like n=1 Tax=Papilio machaon TaxID=76193 RepID=UPI001E665D60|nr:peritrophin-1-like [Papilio machaon]